MRSSRLATLAAAFGLAVATLAIASINAPAVDAHERRTVAGQYTFVVGFINEPAIAGQVNGIDLRITNAQTNEPVEGVEKTLKADVSVGQDMKTYDLRARFGQRGAYTATLIPTKPGVWTFRFYGEINGTRIDERFESGPGRFNDVEAVAAYEFPAQAREDALASINGTEAAAEAQRALEAAQDARRTGIAVGAAGLVAGLAGIGLAAVALSRRPRAARPTGRNGGEPA
jgi:hypothetical protein